ncbi:hypothetical protein IWX90DRAFT_485360 [Phyllosticta citrichinensis]|uniref:C2H2-type domain-containing protein n=1 Tax=Phyllosticta citrichinensis TaxID=1130410 RepID=A0ABR1XVY7_9PEZI
MPPTHAEPTHLGNNEHDNQAATRDSPGEAPDPGAKANAGEVKAMAVAVTAIAKEEEGAADSEEGGDEDEDDEDDDDNDDEQEPSNSATAKDAARKATKRAWYLKNREKIKLQKAVARANEDKEVQQLLLAQYRRKRGGPSKKVTDYETWMTWLRCPICGTRKANEKLLVMHQRKEYVGEKNTQKRKDARAEAGMEVDDEAELWEDDDEAETKKDEEAEQEKDEEVEQEKDEKAEQEKEQ